MSDKSSWMRIVILVAVDWRLVTAFVFLVLALLLYR